MTDRELANTVSDDDAPSAAPTVHGDDSVLGRGAVLGRYIVLDRLGAGGMGVVYAAYDPELDRKVAVKLLRDDTGPDRRARLKREAQALAKLDHPNIVSVYDVGELDDQLFVAMELVGGRTVTAWLAEETRSWREILDVYREAGGGLAAAHSLGIVHRDFKPDNVLIGEDGRVRVVDFGLAAATHDAEARAPVVPELATGELATDLTRTGALVGTPGFIAPEQLEGKTQPSVDQFSFCVAVWRGLHGELPFAGDSATALATAAQRGEVREPKRRVPAWIQRALRRGLAADPTQRHAGMPELLAALDRDPARRRFAIAAGVAIPVIAAAAYIIAPRSEAMQPCRNADRAIAGAWDRGAITRAFGATNVPYAAATAASVTAMLDRYTTSWVTMRTDACEATQVRGEQSGELLDLRMACLDDRGRELRALGDVFAHADAKVIERAVQAAQALTPIADCADATALKAPIKLPDSPAMRARIATLSGDLAEAKTLDHAGKYADALTRAQAIVKDAHVLAYRPLEGRALWLQGLAQGHLQKMDVAVPTLEASVNAAIAARDDATAAAAGTELIKIIGYDNAKMADAERWIARTQAFLEAHPDDRIHLDYDNAIGSVRMEAGHYDEAVDHHGRALALSDKLNGRESSTSALTLDNLGNDYAMKGDAAKGSDFHRRALAIQERLLGPTHPRIALTLTNLAGTLEDEGKYDEALTAVTRSIVIKEAVYGKDTMMVGASQHELGNVYFLKGDYVKAAETYGHVVDVYRKELGPDHPRLGNAISSYAHAVRKLHDLDRATELQKQALAIRVKAFGPTHHDVAGSYDDLGNLALERKQWAEALADFQHAIDIFAKTVDKDSPSLASVLNGEGDAQYGGGHVAEAIVAYTHALAIREAKHVDPVDIAQSKFGLGKALWDSGDHAKGRPLVEQAEKVAAAAGAAAADGAREMQAWLGAHH